MGLHCQMQTVKMRVRSHLDEVDVQGHLVSDQWENLREKKVIQDRKIEMFE